MALTSWMRQWLLSRAARLPDAEPGGAHGSSDLGPAIQSLCFLGQLQVLTISFYQFGP